MSIKIGELAKMTNVSQRTIHYYEELGLISSLERKGQSHRQYDEVTAERIEKIKVLKNIGLSLDEIAEVIHLYFEPDTVVEGKRKVIKMLEKQLAETDAKISDLKNFKKDIEKNISHIKSFIKE
ncbi:MAG: MerR family transcriptional regulator [Deferribacterales bacterium]